MTNVLTAIAAAFALFSATPSAQQPTAPAAGAEPAHKVYLLTGCLEATTDPRPGFKLTDASAIGQQPSAASAEAVAVGTSGVKRSYELRAVASLTEHGMKAEALKAHVGQRVEIEVRPAEVTASPAPASVNPAAPVAPEPERYIVTTMKRVIGACS